MRPTSQNSRCDSEPPSGTAQHRRPASRGRGQTEPLAALIAVTAVCVVISLYVGALSAVVGDSESDRRLAESSMEGIWRDSSDDGVFAADTEIAEAVSPSSIPDGHTVAVEVTVVEPDGSERTADRARLGESGATGPPEDAERVSRPVSVERAAGDVRPGRLVVEVWS